MAGCMTPYDLKTDSGVIAVPCGKCETCLSRRVSQWSFRLRKHGQAQQSALFITLTYNNETLPKSKNNFSTLCKNDLQRFFKRLRQDNLKKYGTLCYADQWNKKQQKYYTVKRWKYNKKTPRLTYYAVGEYGSQSGRPHYHAIVFNADIELLERNWTNGHLHTGSVTGASIGYTLKYMAKPTTIPHHNRDDREKEFSIMSKGIGKNYLSEKVINWHKKDLTGRMYCPMEEGKKVSMPRYYKDKIYSNWQKEKLAAHFREMHREEEMLKNEEDYEKNYQYLKFKLKHKKKDTRRTSL